MWTNVRIILGISASMGVNLMPDLIAALREKNAEVDAILTPAGSKMVSPLYVAGLTGRRVYADEFYPDAGWEVPHIALVKDVAAFIAAPATANLVGKLAHGIADNLLATAFLACRAPRIVCPAMHPFMWQDPILQDNIKTLRDKGVMIVGPVHGLCVSGDEGIGALAPPQDIVHAIERVLGFIGPKKE